MTTRSEYLFPLMLSGLICSFLAPYLHRLFHHKIHFILVSIPSILFIYFLTLASDLPIHGSFFSVTSWVEIMKIDFTFRLDGLSLLFSLLISFFGIIIVLYSGKYLSTDQDRGRFYSLLLMFMIAMLGLVMANHLLILFLFWELTTFTSFLLIGFDHHKKEAQESGWQAIIVTSFGALAMLGGFILLGEVSGSYNITTILERHAEVKSSGFYGPILVLILLGAFTKSAQFPFYFWLPAAMTAPTPISAYLHSVTMVKAGIYLMARFLPVLGHTSEWFSLLVITGSLTMFIGTFKALIQDDLKLILAYLTLSSLGLLTILLGMGDPKALKAFMVYLLVHSFYKASLFLSVGTIDHTMGSRQVGRLNGLIYQMPRLSIAIILALLAMVSLPPSLGFIAKEFIFKAAIHYPSVLIILIFNLVLTTYLGLNLLRKIFRKTHLMTSFHEKKGLWLPSFILASVVTITGLIPWWLEFDFIKSFLSSLIHNLYVTKVFEGIKIDRVLFLSITTIVLSLLIFPLEKTLKEVIERVVKRCSYISPARFYKRCVSFVLEGGKLIEWLSLRDYYHKYMRVILLTCILCLIYGIFHASSEWSIQEYTHLNLYEWGLVGVILLSTVSSILVTNLISSVMILGVLGFTIAIIFVSYGAPDLALTQLFVETLTIILFALIAIKFPAKNRHHFNSTGTKKDLILAVSMGSLVTVLLLGITSKPFNQHLSLYFNDHAYTLGKGRNVVNVILVDFRALDTLGEITVLSIAGIGFFALLKLGLRRRPS